MNRVEPAIDSYVGIGYNSAKADDSEGLRLCLGQSDDVDLLTAPSMHRGAEGYGEKKLAVTCAHAMQLISHCC